MITSEWPSEEHPSVGSFIKRQAEFLAKAGVNIDVYNFKGEKKLRIIFNLISKFKRK